MIVDYSWARPSPADIKAAGYDGVIRYLSHEPGKDLSGGERDRLFAVGLSVGLVWETAADRPRSGYPAGLADGREANARADALGWPVTKPIAYAVDYDPVGDYEPVRSYFDGASDAGGRPVAVYGPYGVLEDLGAHRPVDCYWQCAAMSGRGQGTGGSFFVPAYGYSVRRSRLACLMQLYGSNPIDGTDHNEVLADPVDLLWHPDEDKTPPEHEEEDEDMVITHIMTSDPDGQWAKEMGESGVYSGLSTDQFLRHLSPGDVTTLLALRDYVGASDPNAKPTIIDHGVVPDSFLYLRTLIPREHVAGAAPALTDDQVKALADAITAAIGEQDVHAEITVDDIAAIAKAVLDEDHRRTET